MNAPYLLADDLSGALEAGAAYRAAGWKVVLPLEAGSAALREAGCLEVVSSETRSLGLAEAADTVRRLVAVRRAVGARLLFKKIDSTLRGPWGAEVDALIRELTPRLTVVCPANPAVGRTVIDGIVHVDRVRLEETDFRHDPAWPAQTGDVRVVLARQGRIVAGHIPLALVAAGQGAIRAHVTALCAEDPRSRVLVSDATDEEHLRALLMGVHEAGVEAVFVGSGAMASVLAELSHPAQRTAITTQPIPGPMMVLCGSRHPASHRQLEKFAREDGAAVLQANPGVALSGIIAAAIGHLGAGRNLIVKCDPSAKPAAPNAVAEWLARIAAGIAERGLPGLLYLTGGETAFAVCRSLGGRSLEIIRALEAGVILARLRRRTGGDVTVITKPGGFGNDEVICRNIHEIRAGLAD